MRAGKWNELFQSGVEIINQVSLKKLKGVTDSLFLDSGISPRFEVFSTKNRRTNLVCHVFIVQKE